MNTHAKGRRLEKMAADDLKSRGFRVIKVISTKYGKQDFFGCFDVVGVDGYEAIGIQVKANYCPPAVFQELAVFATRVFGAFRVEIWVKKDRKPWKKSYYDRILKSWVGYT